MFGLTDEEVAAVRQGRFEVFAEAERALLRMADAMADTPARVTDDLYADLRRHYSEEQLIELAASAAQENYRARFNRVFDVDSHHLYRVGMIYKSKS